MMHRKKWAGCWGRKVRTGATLSRQFIFSPRARCAHLSTRKKASRVLEGVGSQVWRNQLILTSSSLDIFSPDFFFPGGRGNFGSAHPPKDLKWVRWPIKIRESLRIRGEKKRKSNKKKTPRKLRKHCWTSCTSRPAVRGLVVGVKGYLPRVSPQQNHSLNTDRGFDGLPKVRALGCRNGGAPSEGPEALIHDRTRVISPCICMEKKIVPHPPTGSSTSRKTPHLVPNRLPDMTHSNAQHVASPCSAQPSGRSNVVSTHTRKDREELPYLLHFLGEQKPLNGMLVWPNFLLCLHNRILRLTTGTARYAGSKKLVCRPIGWHPGSKFLEELRDRSHSNWLEGLMELVNLVSLNLVEFLGERRTMSVKYRLTQSEGLNKRFNVVRTDENFCSRELVKIKCTRYRMIHLWSRVGQVQRRKTRRAEQVKSQQIWYLGPKSWSDIRFRRVPATHLFVKKCMLVWALWCSICVNNAKRRFQRGFHNWGIISNLHTFVHPPHCKKKKLLNCLQLTCGMLQPSCHPNSTCLHVFGTVTVHQSLAESLLENAWSNNRSFVGLSGCQLKEVEPVFFAVPLISMPPSLPCPMLAATTLPSHLLSLPCQLLALPCHLLAFPPLPLAFPPLPLACPPPPSHLFLASHIPLLVVHSPLPLVCPPSWLTLHCLSLLLPPAPTSHRPITPADPLQSVETLH
ncbi:hypothetical protein VP01_704g1 [Puccinia sorghi]|uniref:Uncharacterized protein n=1 Tax=Puccinia sorghi TaxID=27349 RepID=A0A0L6UDQ1_9BASI|nr:hypothetical protein VP01_704g1 [Puccinia sorghi]